MGEEKNTAKAELVATREALLLESQQRLAVETARLKADVKVREAELRAAREG